MGAVWSDQHKYECWLEVELAASEALAELGEVPKEAAAALRPRMPDSISNASAKLSAKYAMTSSRSQPPFRSA